MDSFSLDEIDALGGFFEQIGDDHDSILDEADEIGHANDVDMDAGGQQAFGMDDFDLAAELGHAVVVRQEMTRRYVQRSPALMAHARSVRMKTVNFSKYLSEIFVFA